jgi:hypothetical protein
MKTILYWLMFSAFVATSLAQHITASKVTVTGSGTFTNTQIHQYVTSMIGGIDPNMYHAIQGFPGYTTEAGSFGLSVPSSATAKEADALVGMVTSFCNSSGRTTCNTVAVSGHAQAMADGAGVWGQNTTVSNSIGTTSTNLVGNEIDVGINGDQSSGYVHGLDIFLSPAAGSTMPSSIASAALEIGATPPNAPPAKWGQGIYIIGTSIQSTGNALYVDPTCGGPSPCNSAKITLTGFDGATPHFGSWYVDSTGNAIISTEQGTGAMSRLIGSGTATTAGTAIGSGAAQGITITVTGALTTDVATCSTNAAYGANWASISVLPPIVTANTVTLNIVNPSAGSVTPAAQTFRCSVRR